LVRGKPGYSTYAIKTITNDPMKCPTCSGPKGIERNGFARSPSKALTAPYFSSSKYDSSASANGCCSSNCPEGTPRQYVTTKDIEVGGDMRA
jgi:hypothetical protein